MRPSGFRQDHGVEIEGSDAYGIDVQFWWEPIPQKEHATVVTIGPLYFDKNLVSWVLVHMLCCSSFRSIIYR
jgi:hypothetical protein